MCAYNLPVESVSWVESLAWSRHNGQVAGLTSGSWALSILHVQNRSSHIVIKQGPCIYKYVHTLQIVFKCVLFKIKMSDSECVDALLGNEPGFRIL